MQGPKDRKIISRYFSIIVMMAVVGISILLKALYVMVFEHNYWQVVSSRYLVDSVAVEPRRGNILSDNGELMASSVPQYTLFMDFMVSDRDEVRRIKAQNRRDSLLRVHETEICEGLHRILPDKSVEEFRQTFRKGRERKSRYCKIYPKRVSYAQYKEIKKLPVLSQRSSIGGFFTESNIRREKIYGSLAQRTLGDVYAKVDSAKNGIELAYDEYLRGEPGLGHKKKVNNEHLTIVDVPAKDGMDVLTTLNVEIQDIAEKALLDVLHKQNEVHGGDARTGVVIVMEVATGDVLAIVNLGSGEERGVSYTEQVFNHALKTPINPGSTMKLISTMALVELAGYDTETRVDVEHCSPQNPKWVGATRVRDSHDVVGAGNDSNITLEYAFAHSSNLYFAKAIYENFSSNPTRYTDFLRHLGLDSYVGLEAYGEESCRWTRADMPEWNINGSTSSRLPMMAYGYEIEIPPIHMATIYNGIANGGRMVAPRFVRSIKRDGQTIERMPVVTLVERMCSPRTLSVVEECMAAASLYTQGIFANLPVEFGCKTGTAQVLNNFNSVGRIDRMLMNRGISFSGN